LDLTECQIVVAARISRRGLGAHLRPIRIQLLGHDGGEPRIGTLAHLEMLDDDRHRIVRRDAHEGVGREHAVCRIGDAGAESPTKADGQSGGGGRGTLEKATAVRVCAKSD
jgi:hypothetical protein